MVPFVFIQSRVEFEKRLRLITLTALLSTKGVLRGSHYYLCTHPTTIATHKHTAKITDTSCLHDLLARVNVGAIFSTFPKQVVLEKDADLSKAGINAINVYSKKILVHQL